jgi:putative hemolysin
MEVTLSYLLADALGRPLLTPEDARAIRAGAQAKQPEARLATAKKSAATASASSSVCGREGRRAAAVRRRGRGCSCREPDPS